MVYKAGDWVRPTKSALGELESGKFGDLEDRPYQVSEYEPPHVFIDDKQIPKIHESWVEPCQAPANSLSE